MELSGWGRYPRHQTEALRADSPESVPGLITSHPGFVARGNGRAYGDAAIGERATLLARPLDRMRSFDPVTCRLTVEAGVLLSEIIDVFLPRGLFPPVVPGTKFVTVGGMIAADVHGKNHHREGGFGDHVEELTLALPTGHRVRCSGAENAALFLATLGGMGLTGVIMEATFPLKRIESGWLRQQTIVAENLTQALDALEETSAATYSVAWIDCLARGANLGRSLIYVAEHATAEEAIRLGPDRPLFTKGRPGRLGVPLDLPSFTLNSASGALFNEFYFRRGAAKAGGPVLVHWDPYFFPLDGVANWNRLYGRRGFVQHQCVIPTGAARSVLPDLVRRFARAGFASPLAVLKKLGPSRGTISFGMEGYTLALDLPASAEVFRVLEEIDGLVVEAGGRLYLAKDARQARRTFEAGYPGLRAFRDVRREIGAEGRVSSQLSARLGI